MMFVAVAQTILKQIISFLRSLNREKGELIRIKNPNSNLILITYTCDLSIRFTNGEHVVLSQREMIVIPRETSVKIELITSGKLLLFTFEKYINICPFINDRSFGEYFENRDYSFYKLPLITKMMKLTDLFLEKLKLEPQCVLYHDAKQLDLFLYLSMCYNTQDISRLLYPLHSDKFAITDLVHKYADKVENVNELVELSGMSRTTFYSKFKEVYNVPIKQWLINRKAKRIKRKLQTPGSVIKEIRYEFGFNSASQFNRFCKSYLGDTPSKIKKNSNY